MHWFGRLNTERFPKLLSEGTKHRMGQLWSCSKSTLLLLILKGMIITRVHPKRKKSLTSY